MVPRGISVAMRDVPIMHRKGEYVEGMEQRRLAATKDVPIYQGMEGSVSSMVHHGQRSIAAIKDAPTKLSTEAGPMEVR